MIRCASKMTRTLIILALDIAAGKADNSEFYYGNGLNACGGDYIDELEPELGDSADYIRRTLIGKGFSVNGAGFDYNAPIGDCLLVWLDSIHILYFENAILSQVETLRKHQ